MLSRRLFTLSFIFTAALTSAGLAQSSPLAQSEVGVFADSGVVLSTAETRSVIWSEVLHVPDVPWVRLIFDDATLGVAPAGGYPTQLRITSLYDGAVQTLNSVHVEQWQHTSAYFNGGTLLLEIVADPGSGPSRLKLSSAWAGAFSIDESICGGVDDRLPSDDPRVGRKEPTGCTSWLINDVNNCLLTAGHCTGVRQVVEFNVPLSDANGNAQHPGPEDQYSVDSESLQSSGGGGIGNDWAYFGIFANSTTGLHAHEVQGFFVLADVAPPDTGQDIRITGFGSTDGSVPPEWDGAQKTHVGPYTGVSGNSVNYQTDTTGGNSGSPVIEEPTGLAIGIHTHGGCSGGANHGTKIDNPVLQAALDDPLGVCRPSPLNDDCDEAFHVSGGELIEFDTLWATTDGFAESLCTGASNQIDQDVWYVLRSECDGEVTVDLCGSGFDTRLAVYSNNCPLASNLAVACDDDGSCGMTSMVTFNASGGADYLIRAGGVDGAFGLGNMTITVPTCVEAPSNDSCGSAAFLSAGTTAFSTLGAGTDGPDEPGACDVGGSSQIDNDIWYRYVSDCDGTATISLCNADFDTRIAVYGTACPGGSGQVIACNDDACGLQSEVTFATTSGSVHRVRVGGTDGATGSGEIVVSCGVDPGCVGDTNSSGIVDVDDLNNVILDWGTDGSANGGDLTGPAPDSPPDGTVDVNDLNTVIVNWGPCP